MYVVESTPFLLIILDAFSDDEHLRFEVALLSSMLLLQDGIVRCVDARDAYFCDRDNVIPTQFRDGEDPQHFLQLPQAIHENFKPPMGYDKVAILRPDDVDLSFSALQLLAKSIEKSRAEGSWSSMISVEQSLVTIEQARSHASFGEAMKHLGMLFIGVKDLRYLDLHRTVKVFKK